MNEEAYMTTIKAQIYLAQVYADIIDGYVPVIEGDDEEQKKLAAFTSIARMCGDHIVDDVSNGSLSLPDSIKVSAEVGRILWGGKEEH